jgi:hypothetical protein
MIATRRIRDESAAAGRTLTKKVTASMTPNTIDRVSGASQDLFCHFDFTLHTEGGMKWFVAVKWVGAGSR